MHLAEQGPWRDEIRTSPPRAPEDSAREAERSQWSGSSHEAPPLTPANVMAIRTAVGNHSVSRAIVTQAQKAPARSRAGDGRRLQRMRISSAVLNANFVGISQNNPGAEAELNHNDRIYRYHYHANNYREGDLWSITLTVWSEASGRRQHVTATENRHGEWGFRRDGDQILPWATAEDKLSNKIRLLGEAQSRVRDIPLHAALDMPLDALVANSGGRHW